MKTIVLFFLFYCHLYTAFAQPVATWEQQLARAPRDTTRVNLLNQLAAATYTTRTSLAAQRIREARALAQQLQYTRGVADSYFNESLIHRLHDENTQQLATLREAENLYNQLGDSVNLARTYTETGIAYHQQSDTASALHYYRWALRLHQSLGNIKAQALVLRRLGALEDDGGHPARALIRYEEALSLQKRIQDPEGMANLLNNIGVAYYGLKQYDTAMHYYKAALKIQLEISNTARLPAAYYNIGRLLYERGQYQEALAMASKGLPIAHQIGSRMALVESTRLHADIYQALGQHALAYRYLKEHMQVKDSVVNEKNAVQFANLKARVEHEKQQQEIDYLKQRQNLETLEKRVAWGGLILALAVLIPVIVLMRRDLTRKHELLHQTQKLHAAEQALSRTALENKMLKAQELEHDLEFRHKELVTYTLNLAQKNALMENLREGIREVLRDTPPESRMKLNRLIKLIDYTLETEKDWDQFKLYFEKVHASFFERLSAQYPDLTQTDLKLCALISLNLNMKEMAELLGISPESVKTARYRLRRKLNLATEDNLADFMATFKKA